MALVHQAELRPSKLELLQKWAPHQDWFRGPADVALESVGAFRFDDPEGEVGVETLLVRAGDGPVLQVPVTYRGAPLEGAEQFLIGTMQHSVLGDRWVYDAVGDPVYFLTTATAALTGARQAELFVDIDGQRVTRTPTAHVEGNGSSELTVTLPATDSITVRTHDIHTVAHTDQLRLVVLRVPGDGTLPAPALPDTPTLSVGELRGTWSGQSEPLTLVIVSAH